MTAQDLCDDQGYAIAAKTLECSGDTDKANAAYEHYQAVTTCVGGSEPVSFDATNCSSLVLDLACDAVKPDIDDLGAWVPPECGVPRTSGAGACARVWKSIETGAQSCPDAEVVQQLQARYACAADAPGDVLASCRLEEDCAGRPARFLNDVEYALLTSPQCAGAVEPIDQAPCAVVTWTLRSDAAATIETGTYGAADVQAYVAEVEASLDCLPSAAADAAQCGRWLGGLFRQAADWRSTLLGDLSSATGYCSNALSSCSVFHTALTQRIAVCLSFPAVIEGLATEIEASIGCDSSAANADLQGCLNAIGCPAQPGDAASWVELLITQRAATPACANSLQEVSQ